MSRAAPTEREFEQRMEAERRALAEIEDQDERQRIARQPPSEQQEPYARAHEMADQLLDEIQRMIDRSESAGGSANFSQLVPEPDH
eukprot:3175658-Rhodomonas_salina.1